MIKSTIYVKQAVYHLVPSVGAEKTSKSDMCVTGQSLVRELAASHVCRVNVTSVVCRPHLSSESGKKSTSTSGRREGRLYATRWPVDK